MIVTIQYLRAVAALMVLGYHLTFIEVKYGHDGPWLGWLGFGHLGVDLFFLISGFVMACTTLPRAHGFYWRGFLWRRFVRIYPVYWVYFALAGLAYALNPGMVNSSSGAPPDMLRSFFLLPAPEGTLPLLAVSWTLTFEVYFYLVFCLLVALLREQALKGVVAWAVLVAGGMALGLKGMVFSYHNLEFIAGVFAGAWFAGSAAAQERQAALPRVRWLEAVGNASYSIYLSHVLVISVVGRLWARAGAEGAVWHGGFLALAALAAVGYGILSYRMLEKPLLELARRRRGRRGDAGLPLRDAW